MTVLQISLVIMAGLISVYLAFIWGLKQAVQTLTVDRKVIPQVLQTYDIGFYGSIDSIDYVQKSLILRTYNNRKIGIYLGQSKIFDARTPELLRGVSETISNESNIPTIDITNLKINGQIRGITNPNSPGEPNTSILLIKDPLN